MSLEIWFGLSGAILAMALVPGPSALLIASQAAVFGRRQAFSALAGDLAGCTLLVAVVVAGAHSLISGVPWFTSLIRFAGIAYLVLLAVRHLASRAQIARCAAPHAAALFGQGFVTCVANPKLLLHLTVFLPPFLDPTKPLAPQLLVVAATQVAIDGLILGAYACAGGRISRANPQLLSRLAAVAMIGVAATLALS